MAEINPDTMKMIIAVALEMPANSNLKARFDELEEEVREAIKDIPEAQGASMQMMSWDVRPDDWWERIVKKGPVR